MDENECHDLSSMFQASNFLGNKNAFLENNKKMLKVTRWDSFRRGHVNEFFLPLLEESKIKGFMCGLVTESNPNKKDKNYPNVNFINICSPTNGGLIICLSNLYQEMKDTIAKDVAKAFRYWKNLKILIKFLNSYIAKVGVQVKIDQLKASFASFFKLLSNHLSTILDKFTENTNDVPQCSSLQPFVDYLNDVGILQNRQVDSFRDNERERKALKNKFNQAFTSSCIVKNYQDLNDLLPEKKCHTKQELYSMVVTEFGISHNFRLYFDEVNIIFQCLTLYRLVLCLGPVLVVSKFAPTVFANPFNNPFYIEFAYPSQVEFPVVPDNEEQVPPNLEVVEVSFDNLSGSEDDDSRRERDERLKFGEIIFELTSEISSLIKLIDELIEDINKHTRSCRVARITGSSNAILGTVLGVVGFILIPSTFGASMALALAGAILGIAGGGVVAGTTLTEFILEKSKLKIAQDKCDRIITLEKDVVDNMRSYETLGTWSGSFHIGGNTSNFIGAGINIGIGVGTGVGESFLAAGGAGAGLFLLPFNIFTIVKDATAMHKGEPSKITQVLLQIRNELSERDDFVASMLDFDC